MRTVSVRIWSLAAATTPGADRQRLLFQDAQNFGSLPAAQAVRFDKPLDGGLTQPDRLRRGRCQVPQIKKPIRGEVVSELDHLRVIAPQLLTHAAGQTRALLLQLVGHPRPLTQLHNHWLVIRQAPKGVPIGAQAVGQHVSVAPVVPRFREGRLLAPATVKRARNRSSCLGLIPYTQKPRSNKASTTGPC